MTLPGSRVQKILSLAAEIGTFYQLFGSCFIKCKKSSRLGYILDNVNIIRECRHTVNLNTVTSNISLTQCCTNGRKGIFWLKYRPTSWHFYSVKVSMLENTCLHVTRPRSLIFNPCIFFVRIKIITGRRQFSEKTLFIK